MIDYMTTDGKPPRERLRTIQAVKTPKLREFLEAALNPYRQFQAESLGEAWIIEFRGGTGA